MKHAAVLELAVSHRFHADGRCRELVFEPTAETRRLLDAHRHLVRSSPGRFVVITPLGAAQPLVPLPAGSSLRFDLRIASDDFALFTDLSALQRTPSPLFSNAQMAVGQTGELALTTRMVRDPKTGADVPAEQPPGVLAEAEIVLRDGDAIGRALPTAGFQITFQPRQRRWAFYCITDLAADGGVLNIVDVSGAADALSFGDASRTELTEHPDPSDPIGTQLVAHHPGLRCMRFVSDQAVACSDRARTALELRLDGERVSSPLPNPSLWSFTRRELAAPALPEELLFQIVEYRVQPFSHP
ncbi:MAG TPA: hypothetical protein VF516_38040 [Kofleriaceae bacterium]